MKRKGLITTVAFVLVIAIFSLGSLIAPDRSFSDNENRGLQRFPKLSLSSVLRGETQSLINDYASDQLIFRDGLITLKTCIQYWGGKRDIGDTYIGKGGQYLDKLLESDLNSKVFTNNVNAIAQFSEIIKENTPNSKLYLLPIPTSAINVSDTLPIGAELFSQEDRIDSLKQIENVNYVDIYSVFKASGKPLYYKTDPHWTADGAYLAYTEFCKAASLTATPFENHSVGSDSFRGTLYSKAPLPFAPHDTVLLYNESEAKDYTVSINGSETKGIYDMQYLQKKDKYSVFLGGNQPYVTVSGGKGKGNLLIIRDSFASSMLPYLMENYESVSLLDTRYYTGSVTQLINDTQFTDIVVMLGLKNFVEDKTLPIILG